MHVSGEEFCRILADDPELQALRKPEIPRRSRYYQSVSDINHLDKGMKYGALPDMYVIFICMFDPFGEGLAQGREEMISAIRYLTDNGRTSEINRLAADPDFLTQILKEMGS